MSSPNQHGGYRKPANPAPVSGPGAMSRRTDGRPDQIVRDIPDAAYGEQKTFREVQTGAPLNAETSARPTSIAPSSMAPLAAESIVPLLADSQRAEEPVTSGAAMGAGPGVESLNLSGMNIDRAQREKLKNMLPTLEIMAASPYASEETRQTVRMLRSMFVESSQ